MNTATFFLSTGRCGTQWLARNLRAVVGEAATIRHEPIYLDWWPRQLLGLGDPARLEDSAPLQRHLAYIDDTLRQRPYVECGWPCYGAVPYLLRRYAGRVRIVHLVRHPLSTAWSLTTHNWYSFPPRFKFIAERGELSPFDAGTRLTQYRQRWETLSAFDRCLYFWGEIHSLGLALEAESGVPWLRLRYEELFPGGEGLAPLTAFLGLGDAVLLRQRLEQREDRVSFQASGRPESGGLERHPELAALARRLGYDPAAAPEPDLAARYAAPTRRAAGPVPPQESRNRPCPCGSGLRFKHCHGAPGRPAS